MQKEGVLKINNWYFIGQKLPKMIPKLFILNGRRQNAARRADVGIKSRRNRRRCERRFLSAIHGGCKGGNAVVIVHLLMSSICQK